MLFCEVDIAHAATKEKHKPIHFLLVLKEYFASFPTNLLMHQPLSILSIAYSVLLHEENQWFVPGSDLDGLIDTASRDNFVALFCGKKYPKVNAH